MVQESKAAITEGQQNSQGNHRLLFICYYGEIAVYCSVNMLRRKMVQNDIPR